MEDWWSWLGCWLFTKETIAAGVSILAACLLPCSPCNWCHAPNPKLKIRFPVWGKMGSQDFSRYRTLRSEGLCPHMRLPDSFPSLPHLVLIVNLTGQVWQYVEDASYTQSFERFALSTAMSVAVMSPFFFHNAYCRNIAPQKARPKCLHGSRTYKARPKHCCCPCTVCHNYA